MHRLFIVQYKLAQEKPTDIDRVMYKLHTGLEPQLFITYAFYVD